MKNVIFLSYVLDDKLSAYGNGDRLKSRLVRSQCCGDSTNNSEITMPVHLGTHLDFPYHFSSGGKRGESYRAGEFIFRNIKILDLSTRLKESESEKRSDDRLITSSFLRDQIGHMKNDEDKDVDFVLLMLGGSLVRKEDIYWNANWGFDLGCAKLLKEFFPNLRCVGFDGISLSSFRHREIGRKAHVEFLCEEALLILEDMDLNILYTDFLNVKKNIDQMIVSPLRFNQSDGAPCTVFAFLSEGK